MTDFDLERFVTAQDVGGDYTRAVAELRRGRKTSHWMWFVFPQVAGLGRSAMSRRYAISSVQEARAYLAHPVLGPRLREVSEILLSIEHPTAMEVFGSIDAQKLRSSMTLFEQATLSEPTILSEPTTPVAPTDADVTTNNASSAFQRVLELYFNGESDRATLALLKR